MSRNIGEMTRKKTKGSDKEGDKSERQRLTKGSSTAVEIEEYDESFDRSSGARQPLWKPRHFESDTWRSTGTVETPQRLSEVNSH